MIINIRIIAVTLVIVLVSYVAGWTAESLTVEEAVTQALESNRQFLATQEEVVRAQSQITEARSGALPQLSFDASYTRNIMIPSFFFTVDDETAEFKSGFTNNFNAQLSLYQPLWQGGKVFAALDIARTYRKYTDELVSQAKAEVTYNARVLFYTALLSKSTLEVYQKSHEAALENLNVVTHLREKGMVSDYELLRAKVEVANLQPKILRAESDVKLSAKNLLSFLGMDINSTIGLTSPDDDTSLTSLLSVEELVTQALASRPELLQASYNERMRKKAIRVAKGGYLPSLGIVSVYNWQGQSDQFRTSDNNSRSFTAGLQLSIPIFNGGQTHGEVVRSKADHNQAILYRRDVEERIKLEVESSYDLLTQSKKALDVQLETVASASEGLRIANLRYESNIGTQLEVLSAQAALTLARSERATALFGFRKAKAELTKATNQEI